MKALVLDRANTFRYEERPIPQCLPGQLLVRMEAVCICGSDLHAIRGDQPLFSFPRVIGHEAKIFFSCSRNLYRKSLGRCL